MTPTEAIPDQTRTHKRQASNREALRRCSNRQPNGNDVAAILQFEARGITDVITIGPDQNVFTYAAWQAKGRQVRKGEKSVRVTVWCSSGEDKTDPETGKTRKAKRWPRTACLFHVSQTDPKGGVA